MLPTDEGLEPRQFYDLSDVRIAHRLLLDEPLHWGGLVGIESGIEESGVRFCIFLLWGRKFRDYFWGPAFKRASKLLHVHKEWYKVPEKFAPPLSYQVLWQFFLFQLRESFVSGLCDSTNHDSSPRLFQKGRMSICRTSVTRPTFSTPFDLLSVCELFGLLRYDAADSHPINPYTCHAISGRRFAALVVRLGFSAEASQCRQKLRLKVATKYRQTHSQKCFFWMLRCQFWRAVKDLHVMSDFLSKDDLNTRRYQAITLTRDSIDRGTYQEQVLVHAAVFRGGEE